MDNRDLLANIFYSQNLEGLRRSFYLAPIFGLVNIFGLSSLDAEKITFLIVRVFTGFFAFYAISNFIVSKVKANKNEKSIFLVAIFGGFFYAYNPVATTMVSTTLGFAFSYAMLPLSLYFFDRALSKRDFQSILVAAIMISLTLAGTTQYLVLLTLFLLLPWFLITICSQRERNSAKTIIRTLLFVSVFVILISSFWILPAISSGFAGVALEPGYIITTDFLNTVSYRTPLDKVVRLMGDWWPRIELTPLFDETSWIFLTFVIPAAVILFMIFPTRPVIKFYIVAFFLISLLIMFFNKGSQFPVSGFYPILFDIPIIGWMFRIPSKFAMILALTYTMLVSFGLYGLISYRALRFRKPVIYSLFLAMLICITMIGWPMFTGDFGGIYQDKKYLPRLDNPTSKLHLVFTPPEQNFAVIGGSHQLDLLKEYPAVDINNQSSIIFLDQALSTPYDTTVLKNLIINDKDSMLMHFIPNDSIVLSPFDSTKRYSPNEIWSRAQTNYAAINGSFPTYLAKYSIRTSDLDYGRGIVFTLGHDKLPLPFNIIHAGNYELFVRYLESKAGGTINVGFDEKPIYSLNTLGTSDGFSWKNIGNFHLPAGHHVISIESVRGFNAVSLFMLIPSEAVQNQYQQVDNLLKSSRTIQVLGSEGFIPVMSPKGAEEIIPAINGSTNRNLTGEFDVPDGTFDGIVRSSSDKLSNVHVSILNPNAELRTHIEPITSSNYFLSFLVKTCNDCTTLKVRIGDSFHELPLRSNDTNFKWFNIPEYLSADGADISISSSNRVEFGGLIIYSLPNDPSGSRTTVESPLLKIDLDKAEINPNKYRVKANFSVPFILKFEKPFNSLWRANVNGHEYSSVQIFAEESLISEPTRISEYPAVNGFLIDKTGQLDITIEYTPHEWFQIGLVISLATLGLSLIYLAWQKWKQGKKIKRVEKPRAGSSMKIAPISTDAIERIGNSLAIRENQIVLICALILLLSLPFLIALHQDSNIISNVMALTYVLLIVAGISLFTLLILQKPASDSVNAVKRSPASADEP